MLPLANLPPLLDLTTEELEALSRLGPDAWERWSVRGYLESTAEEA